MSQENNITEWMTPIAEEAKPIFAEFSQETAIEIAAGVLKGEDTDEKTIIPWATVFTSDDKQRIGEYCRRQTTKRQCSILIRGEP
jgi:hypothetical protein